MEVFQKSVYRGEQTGVTVREQGLCTLLVVRTLPACVKPETDYTCICYHIEPAHSIQQFQNSVRNAAILSKRTFSPWYSLTSISHTVLHIDRPLCQINVLCGAGNYGKIWSACGRNGIQYSE